MQKMELINLHDSEWLDRQRIAGSITDKCLKRSFDLISDNNDILLSEVELSAEIADAWIKTVLKIYSL